MRGKKADYDPGYSLGTIGDGPAMNIRENAVIRPKPLDAERRIKMARNFHRPELYSRTGKATNTPMRESSRGYEAFRTVSLPRIS